MARGRKPIPDEIKALKGNPGKRKLIMSSPADDAGAPLKAPSYVSKEEEKKIFARVAEELNRVRFVRRTDTDALGRWAVYLARWVSIKKRLDGKRADVYYETESKHGKMLRVHPLYASLLQLEKQLLVLEDRLGLNPTSRQSILRGLINAPQIPPGGLFGEPAKPEQPDTPTAAEAGTIEAFSAVGFLGQKH